MTPGPCRHRQDAPVYRSPGRNSPTRRGLAIACLIALPFLAFGLAAPPTLATELRIATWNLEHLDDTDGHGCVGRSQSDYDAMARQAAALGADIVAFQEVENEAAARRVFPASTWDLAMSSRPPMLASSRCRVRPHATIGHLGTGFALRRGVDWRRHPDLSALGEGRPFQRWGTDITVTADGRELRLLSVHLRSGCWGAAQDDDGRRDDACALLRRQIARLKAWADARRSEGTPFVILGDFNRLLALPGDWAWRMLSPPSAPLRLATANIETRCDPHYSSLIDHVIAGAGAQHMLLPGSVREAPRRGRHPDHCAISATFRVEG